MTTPTDMTASRLPRPRFFLALAAVLCAGLAACEMAPPAATPAAPAAAETGPVEPLPWHDAGQLVLVTSAGWDDASATLRRYERSEGQWRQVGGEVPVMLGRNGSAWGIGLHPDQAAGPHKREGDGRAPAGVFSLGIAFGYADQATSGLPYSQMEIDDWCIDVSQSPLYNRIVNAGSVGHEAVEGSTEPMRRDLHADGDIRYKLGFVVEHNPEGRKDAGSCIFAHLWRQPGEATSGCTAMDEPQMLELLAWLDPARKPVFALLPQPAHAALAAQWQLPAPVATDGAPATGDAHLPAQDS